MRSYLLSSSAILSRLISLFVVSKPYPLFALNNGATNSVLPSADLCGPILLGNDGSGAEFPVTNDHKTFAVRGDVIERSTKHSH